MRPGRKEGTPDEGREGSDPQENRCPVPISGGSSNVTSSWGMRQLFRGVVGNISEMSQKVNILGFVGQEAKWRLLCSYLYNRIQCNLLKM